MFTVMSRVWYFWRCSSWKIFQSLSLNARIQFFFVGLSLSQISYNTEVIYQNSRLFMLCTSVTLTQAFLPLLIILAPQNRSHIREKWDCSYKLQLQLCYPEDLNLNSYPPSSAKQQRLKSCVAICWRAAERLRDTFVTTSYQKRLFYKFIPNW